MYRRRELYANYECDQRSADWVSGNSAAWLWLWLWLSIFLLLVCMKLLILSDGYPQLLKEVDCIVPSDKWSVFQVPTIDAIYHLLECGLLVFLAIKHGGNMEKEL
jgi:hypothetical protein